MTRVHNSYREILEMPTDFRFKMINDYIEAEAKAEEDAEQRKSELKSNTMKMKR